MITIEYAHAHTAQLRREADRARRSRAAAQRPARLRRLVRRSGR